MNKKIYIIVLLTLCIVGCDFNFQDFNNLNENCNVDEKLSVQFQLNDSLDDEWVVNDGKLIYLLERHNNNRIAFEIENAVKVYHARFVLCEDGSYIDLYGPPSKRWLFSDPSMTDAKEWDGTYPVFDLLKELDSSCGIRYIEKEYGWDHPYYYIHAKNDKIYRFADPAGQYDEYDDILTADGKIYDGCFPETSSWENIVDYRSCEHFIIALTSDGKVLSSGIEFSVENAVKINIIYYDSQRIPAALTSDGKLVLGEINEDPNYPFITDAEDLQKYYQSLCDIVTQAETFTDIVDFTYYDGSEFVILAQKSDGTLIATTNDVYNPEYVSQPE